MSFSIFYHIAILPYWKESYEITKKYIENSNILTDCEKIYYCINGNIQTAYDNIFLKDPNKEILLQLHEDCTKFEFPTINYLHNHLFEKETKALYIHTKGASRKDPGYQKYWLDTLCHLNFSQYQYAISLLEDYDAVGPYYTTKPWLHFAGNFWWTKSSHIKKLQPLKNNFENFPHNNEFRERHDAERWICSVPGLYKTLGDNYANSIYKHEYDNYLKNKIEKISQEKKKLLDKNDK